ncbi:MAG: type II secretion system protein GspD, partial [Planctomycetota bacterium]
LDKRRPQVLIDVTLVQITKDDAFSFDLDLLSSIPDMAYISGQTSITSSIVDLLLAPESDRNQFIELQGVKGDFKGFYGDEKINALLTAVQTKGYGRIMARPKLLVNDNVQGDIKTIDTTYVEIKEPSYIGVENPQLTEKVSWQDYSAGITLTITPHISSGDMLRLEITLNRSGFSEKPTGLRPPDKADADITTTVTVPDRSTIILGGMEKIEHTKGGKKVPFFGDLPLIGGIFRSVTRSEGHDKLYIFVKAHILRTNEELALADLKAVSRENRDRFEKLEAEMVEYEDWPGIKSAPMDPMRVLEDD